MTKIITAVSLLVVATPAVAETVTIKPLLDVRLRWEDVVQVGKPAVSDAVTVRLRAGVEAKLPDGFSLLAEGTGTLGIDNVYFNGTPRSPQPTALYPTIADPQTIGLNRLQLAYKPAKSTTITVGRQRINLDDQRFVSNAGWRQNEQTYDAVRLETTPIKNLKADLTYAWNDNTVFGIDGQSRVGTGHIPGDNFFGTLAYTTKIGTLEGFAFVINQDAPSRLGFSSQTYGGRFSGKYAFSKATNLAYTLAYAHQADVKLNPNRFTADYYYGDAILTSGGWTVGGGYEVLGADGAARVKLSNALTPAAFQTPLAALHKWNGWADIFLTTPANGLRDAYGTLGYSAKVKPFTSLGASVTYHQFNADIGGANYGHEWNVQIMAKLKKYTVLIKYADYRAKTFATNTRKFWLSLEWTY